MKLKQIIHAVPALTKLANSDMSLSEAYQLQKLLSSLQVEIDFFNEQKLKIINQYGTIGADHSVEMSKENTVVAQKEIDGLLEIEIQSEFIAVKIPITENVQISANDIVALTLFVEFVTT